MVRLLGVRNLILSVITLLMTKEGKTGFGQSAICVLSASL